MECFNDMSTNAKYKIYPDGTMIAVYSDKQVFNIVPKEKFKPSEHLYYTFPDIKTFKFVFPKLECYNYFDIEPLTGEPTLRGSYYDKNALASYFKYLDDIDNSKYNKKKDDNNRRQDHVKRSQDKIYDLVMLNDWKYFFTGTLGNTSFDPTSAKEALKPVQEWLKNRVKFNGLKYILVAELQPKSGKIHWHGFINDSLKMIDSNTRLVKGYKKPISADTIRKKGIDLDNCKIVYNVPQWKFGFTTAIELYGDRQHVANYIMKYITKENKSIFGRYFWHSQNLVKDPIIFYEDVDYNSIISREYTIPRVNRKFKYYTFFPGQDDFHYNLHSAAQNSSDIIDILDDLESAYDYEEQLYRGFLNEKV